MRQRKLIRHRDDGTFEPVTPGMPLSLGRFSSKARALVALKIYMHFLTQGFNEIPRTMTAAK